MPIAIDPNEKLEIVLASDEDKAPAERPTYVFGYLTRRQAREGRRLWKELNEAADADEWMERMCKWLAGRLIGWRNMTARDGAEIGFDPARLEDTAGDTELMKLFVEVLAANAPGAEERKKSQSQLPSSSDGSANTAGPENAATPRPNGSPTSTPAGSAMDGAAMTAEERAS